MSFFSNQLIVTLQGTGISQSQLSDASHVPISQVNKYARGHYRPSREVLEKLCAALPENVRGAVAAAHLKDELPPSAMDLVEVRVVTEQNPQTVPRTAPELPREMREMFEYFQRAAIEDEAIANWLLSSYRVMHG